MVWLKPSIYRHKLLLERALFIVVLAVSLGLTTKIRLWQIIGEGDVSPDADTALLQSTACGDMGSNNIQEKTLEEKEQYGELDFSKQFVTSQMLSSSEISHHEAGETQFLEKNDQLQTTPFDIDDAGGNVGETMPVHIGSVDKRVDANVARTSTGCSAVLDESKNGFSGSSLAQTQMFWRRGKTDSEPKRWDITLTTQLGINRLGRLATLVKRWQGPVSAAVLVCSPDDLGQLGKWYKEVALSDPLFSLLDIHVAVSDLDPYPINAMRNLARRGLRGRKGLELVVDVDSWVVGDMRAVSDDVQKAVATQAAFRGTDGAGADVIFCLAAFELVEPSNTKAKNEQYSQYPTSRDDLVAMFHDQKVRAMHVGRRSYSGPFRHSEWIAQLTPSAKLLHYEVMFEPYFVVRSRSLESTVLFPEQFVGRGFNKQALHFELFAAEYVYAMLGTSFVVDQAHVSKDWSKTSKGIQENQELWNHFRDSVAKKYGLECREEDWARCDNRGVGCHRVCQDRAAHQLKDHSSSSHKHRRKHQIYGENESNKDNNNGNIHWKLYKEMLLSRSQSGQRQDTISDQHGAPVSCFDDPSASERASIDVVFTWVNGSDSAHAMLQRQYIPEKAFLEKLDVGERRKVSTNGDLAYRFRDFGKASTLRYSLRSIRAFAPWVRKIWVVTAGGPNQQPSWMDTELAKEKANIEFVSHAELFDDPASQLPTFNSCAIESQLHRIKGLANCYLYLNDDFFLTQPMSIDQLFDMKSKMPITFLTGERAPRVGRDPWQEKIATVAKMIHEKLDLRWEHIFSVGHHGFLFVKPVVEMLVQDVFANEFKVTAAQRWRQQTSVWLPFVYNNFIAWNYQVEPRTPKAFYFSLTTQGGASSIQTAFKRISEGEFEWACFNDLAVSFTDEMEKALLDGFERLFPDKPAYET